TYLLTLSDPTGRIVKQQKLHLRPGIYEGELQTTHLAGGVYLLTLATETGPAATEKLYVR
ncbi:MAG: hypothetical protein AAFV07_12975, partial [Bacteroidota bacterium]